MTYVTPDPGIQCNQIDLGMIDYDKAWTLQQTLAEARGANRIGDTLLVLEHPSVYTIGRSGKREHLLIEFGAAGGARRLCTGCRSGRRHHVSRARAACGLPDSLPGNTGRVRPHYASRFRGLHSPSGRSADQDGGYV